MTAAITVRGLHKSYGEYEAVRGIDFTVESGEAVAFLGPNGAGKTTTVEISRVTALRRRGPSRCSGFLPPPPVASFDVGSGSCSKRRDSPKS